MVKFYLRSLLRRAKAKSAAWRVMRRLIIGFNRLCQSGATWFMLNFVKGKYQNQLFNKFASLLMSVLF